MSEEVWNTLASNLVETICNMQWNEEAKYFSRLEMRIPEGWGLGKGNLNGLQQRTNICRVSIPKYWAPPP